MNALLELPAIRDCVARLSVEDHHRLGELPEQRRAEVYRSPSSAGYALQLTLTTVLESTALPVASVHLDRLFAQPTE